MTQIGVNQPQWITRLLYPRLTFVCIGAQNVASSSSVSVHMPVIILYGLYQCNDYDSFDSHTGFQFTVIFSRYIKGHFVCRRMAWPSIWTTICLMPMIATHNTLFEINYKTMLISKWTNCCLCMVKTYSDNITLRNACLRYLLLRSVYTSGSQLLWLLALLPYCVRFGINVIPT